VDLVEGTIRFREKGGKVSIKPMPWELLEILRAAVESKEVARSGDDYVIPNRRPASVRRPERSDKVDWTPCSAWRRAWAFGRQFTP
jgi:hypothetical protein